MQHNIFTVGWFYWCWVSFLAFSWAMFSGRPNDSTVCSVCSFVDNYNIEDICIQLIGPTGNKWEMVKAFC